MSKNITVRITALTCAFLLSLISIGASPFGKKAAADKKAPVVEVPEVEQESFILDQGAAGITEKDIFVEITKNVDTTEPEVEEVPEEEEDVNFVMANVQNSVNVRAEANTDCEVVGMLYNKCGGTILEKGDGWTKVKTGDLTGWIKNDYLMFGDKAIELAKTGVSILIFPEGTRNRDYETDKLLPMHNGSFKIATKSGALIQPMTIVGAENILIRHIPFVKPTKVVVEFGDPIDPKALDKEALKNIGGYVGSAMQETYSSIKRELK